MGSYWSSDEFKHNEDFIEVHKELENNEEIGDKILVDTEIPADIIKRRRKKKRKNRSKNKYGL